MPETTQAKRPKHARGPAGVGPKQLFSHAPHGGIPEVVQERLGPLVPATGPELDEAGGRKGPAEEPVRAARVQEGVQALEAEAETQQAGYDLCLGEGWEGVRQGQGELGDEVSLRSTSSSVLPLACCCPAG